MPLYDFSCPRHGTFEEFADHKKWFEKCPTCGKKSHRLLSVGRINVANEDATHIRESANVLLDKESARFSDKAHVRALAEKPTRTNLNTYLKAEGLRYAENEKGAPPIYRKTAETDTKALVNEVYQKKRNRDRLEVRS
jgi:putative FmdB family regulatory protein